jgi:alpha-amylase
MWVAFQLANTGTRTWPLEWWANNNNSVFDFACYYKMNDAFDGNNLLNDDDENPYKAVTFVNNHDTDEIYNKQLAYAYILTHEGYPHTLLQRLRGMAR